MTLAIIVPVKRLEESKSRLAAVLPEAARRSLALALLGTVLDVVRQAQAHLPAFGVVVSADPQVLELAQAHGLKALPEIDRTTRGHENDPAPAPEANGGERSLNQALDQATAFAAGQGAAALLVLPADLPLLTLAEVRGLWEASQQLYASRAMVIAPDGREEGTNALLVRPAGKMRYQFGPGSFQRHCEQARALDMAWHIYRSAQLGFDVDVPDDLQRYLAVEQADQETREYAMVDDSIEAAIDGEIQAFLNQPDLLMRLGTVGRDGYPHVTPVWYLVEDGVFYITTAGNRVKARNMLANPRVGFAIDDDARPYRGVSAWGEARLLAEGDAARTMTRHIAARYVPAERLDAMVDTLMLDPRVVFAIVPSRLVRMGSWGVGA
jgi:2-phospho-L-lactate guanylyltransferase